MSLDAPRIPLAAEPESSEFPDSPSDVLPDEAVDQRHLLGFGRMAWKDISSLLEGVRCAWADYSGFHVGICPNDAPPYSHLWGWASDGTCYRVRIDDGDGILGVLTTDPNNFKAAVEARHVDVIHRRALAWAHGFERIAPQPGGGLDGVITLHEPVLPLSAAFVSVE